MKDIKRIMQKAGQYFESGQFIFHKFLRNELVRLGFRVVSIERIEHHPVWHIRVRCTATAQNFLLISRPLAKRLRDGDDQTDLLTVQLKAEIRRIAKTLGPPIKSDCISAMRSGSFFNIAFIWPRGSTGLLLRQQPKPDVFSLYVKPWLKLNRN